MLILAAIIAAVVVPVGFALSREADVMTVRTNSPSLAASPIATISVAVPATQSASFVFFPSVPEGVKLFFVGTVLFGLAAAMRRVH